jgi:hypothetical protein
MKILFKYATRSRRDNFLRGIDSIRYNISDKENYHILISVDKDDDKMYPLPVLDCNHTYVVGESRDKVHAINRDIDGFDFDWDILVCMSDDMVFTQPRFDDILRDVVPLDGFVHFPDGNRDDLCTMSIMGREYYNRDKYIYNPAYKSLFCDDEAQQVAKLRGCYKFVDRIIFNHLHPAYGKAIFDEQYQRTEAIGNAIDRHTFEERKGINFGI